MTHYKISPKPDCSICDGRGTYSEHHNYWGFSISKLETCDCILEQLEELGYNESADTFEIEMSWFDMLDYDEEKEEELIFRNHEFFDYD